MPRTADEIVQHANQLEAVFENCPPLEADKHDPRVISLLRGAVVSRGTAERHLIAAVTAARKSGMSWAAIGHFVGTSGEAARQRYSARLT